MKKVMYKGGLLTRSSKPYSFFPLFNHLEIDKGVVGTAMKIQQLKQFSVYFR